MTVRQYLQVQFWFANAEQNFTPVLTLAKAEMTHYSQLLMVV
jgi:hypothetical protein